MRLWPQPKTLQERLDQARADRAEAGLGGMPVAVCINGGKPIYGEFTQVNELDDRMTRFGSESREFMSGFAYELVVEARIDWSDRPLEVRFGDELFQACHGRVRTDQITHEFGVWTTRLVGVGKVLWITDRRIAA